MELGSLYPSRAGVLPYVMRPLNDVTPFTYRSGTTFLEVMELFENYIKTLVPNIDEILKNYYEDFEEVIKDNETDISETKAAWQLIFDGFKISVDTRMDLAESNIELSKNEWQELFDAFLGSVELQIAILNDGAIKGLIESPTSQTRISLNALITTMMGEYGYSKTDIDNGFYGKTAIDVKLALLESKQHAADTYATKTALADQNNANKLDYARRQFSAEYDETGTGNARGNKPYKLGVVIDKGAPLAFDETLVESLTAIEDPESGRLAGVYVGYAGSGNNMKASIGLAYSDDGIRWYKAGKIFGGTGLVGDGDRSGTSGPLLVLWQGIYHLFYIGLETDGYEGAPRSLMLATTPSLKNPVWTRKGRVMGPAGAGWRSLDVWHPSIVRHLDKWYCFVNATGNIGGVLQERIGYATADKLEGPWTFDDVNSPVMSNPNGIIGDPCVTKIPGGWRMDYFTATGGASDWFTTTTDAKFPLGWKAHDEQDLQRRTIQPGIAGTIDDLYAHKPYILHYGGRTFHYYTAVMTSGNMGNRRIALAIDGGVPVSRGTTQSVTIPSDVGTFSQIKSGPGDVDIALGQTWQVITQAKAVVSARLGDLIEFTIGYSADAGNGDARCTVVALNNGVASSYVSAAEHGVTGWGALAGRHTNIGGVYHYIVKFEDIYKDMVMFAPVFRVMSGTRTIRNTPLDPIEFSVRNLG